MSTIALVDRPIGLPRRRLSNACRRRAGISTWINHPMLDLIMLTIGIGAFAATILYVLACERV